jgi:hypothetical protein
MFKTRTRDELKGTETNKIRRRTKMDWKDIMEKKITLLEELQRLGAEIVEISYGERPECLSSLTPVSVN